MHCKHCKTIENLMKSTKTKSGQYYICRECQTLRIANYRKLNKNKIKQIVTKYEAKNPGKKKAWILARKLFRQLCEICGKKAEAHHSNYNKPLEVLWLCKLHHKQWHKENKVKVIELTT